MRPAHLLMTTQDTTRPETTPATAAQVAERELRWHLGKTADDPLVGLAFSGGGIRSATFGLGVLQALHALGVLPQIDYISTVSGGGYIGAWLQGSLARGRGTAAL